MRSGFKARVEPRRHRNEPRPGVVLEVNGVRHPLEPPGLVIGRGIDADLRINDKAVSRRHAKIWVSDRAYGRTVTIVDLDSTNGVIVNGEPVQQAPLDDGAVVKVGSTSMTVRVLGSGEDEPNLSAEHPDQAASSSRQRPPQTSKQHGQMALFWKVLLIGLPIVPIAAYYAGTIADDTAIPAEPRAGSPEASSSANSEKPGAGPAARSWLTQTSSTARSFANWSASKEESVASPATRRSTKSSRGSRIETASLTPADGPASEDPSGPAPENPGGPAPENPGGPAPENPSGLAPENPSSPTLEDPSGAEDQPKSGQEEVLILLETLLQATVVTDPQAQ